VTTQERIDLGRRFLEHAPTDPGPTNPDIAGWNGKGVNVCAVCAGRILARGCDLRTIADLPVWSPNVIDCDIC